MFQLSPWLTLPGENFTKFLLICLLIELTPGPNMAFLAVVSATKGRRFGWGLVWGILVGLTVIGLAAALGLAAMISENHLLYQSITLLGGLYIMWLAAQEWRDASRPIAAFETEHRSVRSYFVHGVAINVLNPKAAIFFLTVLPSFIRPNGSVLLQAIYLTGVSLIIATLVHAAIVLFAGYATNLLKNPRAKARAQRFLSVCLFFIAVWILMSTWTGVSTDTLRLSKGFANFDWGQNYWRADHNLWRHVG